MSEPESLISDRHLRAIGHTAVIWSAIEVATEIALCGLYSIDLNKGLVFTANIGFRNRIDILRLAAKNGAIRDPQLAGECVTLLGRIEQSYPLRNEIIHGNWGRGKDPSKATRMAIRTKGGHLRCTSVEVSAEELEASVAALGALAADFSDLVRRLGFFDNRNP